MANASVDTVRREKTAGPTMTAADGSFKLKIGGFMLVEEDLVASADGGRLMGLAKFVEPRKSGPADPVRIVLKPSRVTKVHVRDAKDQPVQGATVAAVGFGYDGAATTDAGGNALLRVPVGAEVRWVIGLKAGAGFDYFENYRSRPAGDIGPLPESVTLRLDGSRTVRIKAVDTAGQAGGWRRVYAVVYPEAGEARCSQYRRFSGDVGARRTPRAWRLSAGFLRYFGRAHAVLDASRRILMPRVAYCTEPAAMERSSMARLLRNTRIGGVVRHADGRPAAGILMRAEGRGATSHYCRMHTRTGGRWFLLVRRLSRSIVHDRRAGRALGGEEL